MKFIAAAASAIFLLSRAVPCNAQPGFPCDTCIELTSWYFPDTNWLSDNGYSPVGFSNVINITNGCDGYGLLLDTTNSTPAFLFYNIVETNSDSTTFTNMTPQSGTLYLWLNPTWSSSNQSGTGPGDWADIISMGEFSTNGTPWWSWYISPDGNTVYLGSQTNGGSPSVYLSAPVSFVASNWYNLTLTYGPTNCAFYTNGILVTNGVGVTNLPGPGVTFFAIGSDSNGYHQARATLSDVESFNFQLDADTVWNSFGAISICYGLAGIVTAPHGRNVTNAQSSSVVPAPDWFTGLGDLIPAGTAATCTPNSNVWLTNVSASMQTNGTASITFTIEGGDTNLYYDVFGIAALTSPVTNDVWAWLGQGQTCHIYTITNLPGTSAFLILGRTNDWDGDGLTDAFELLVSHTSTNTANTYPGLPDAWIALNGLAGTNGLAGLDPDWDGLNNGQEYLYGTKPLVPEGTAIWVANPAGFSGLP